ncbi:MAG TPA: sigma-70 family RNA polymerase sigma factor [Solirubrobacterales bacterium]|jgi:RNA polymerase sigma factor (sigma-70 family)|nr:sigma-70 family RNA polymerase sigma factor [Solirubrobacterales bacterium]
MSDLAAGVGGAPSLPGLGSMSSDERLVRRAAEGDSRAFAAIYRRYHQDLYRYCTAILGDGHDAQDALQNTMLKVMRALPDERREIRLRPWLYRIAHNEAIDLVRARRSAQPLDPGLEAPGAAPAERAEQRASLHRLLVDLEDLPQRQRGALLMRELGGLTFAEIGSALGASEAVVRQTIYEARLNLRQMNAGRETSCDAVTRALSDADGRVTRRRDIRAHLRQCESCRAFGDQIKLRRRDLGAIAPLPAGAAAGILHGILGGHGSGGGGILGALGGGAGKALGGSAALKSAAAVATVAVVGAGVADRSGLIHFDLPGSRSTSRESSSDLPRGAVFEAGSARRGAPVPKAAPRLGGTPAAKRAGSALDDAANHAGAVRAEKTSGRSAHPAAGAERHKQAGHPDLPSASRRGQETASAHKGGDSAPEHPSASSHPTAPAHPSPESHPGTGQAPPTSEPPATGTGESAAGGDIPKGPPVAGGPAEAGAGGQPPGGREGSRASGLP